MSWLTLGLTAAGLYAGISVTDKIILEKYLNSSWAYPFFTALFFGLYCLLVLLFRIGAGVFDPPSTAAALLALFPGLLHYAAALISTQAMLRADVSTVAAISQAGPIFSVAWGAWFLGEQLSPLNFAGVLLLVVLAALLAREKPLASMQAGVSEAPQHGTRLPKTFRFSPALWLVLLAALLRSLSDLFTKIAVTNMLFWDAFSLSRLGMLAPALILFANPHVRRQVAGPIQRSGVRVIGIVALVEMFALLNLSIITAAYSRGPLALVSATQSLAPLLILALTALLNRLSPGAVPVKPGGLSSLTRLALSGGMIVGVYLLSV